MSDSNENKTNETEDNGSLIGVDPLAWLSDEEKQSVLEESKQQEAVIAEDSSNEEKDITPEETVKTSYTVNLEEAITIRDVAELMDELSFIDAGVTEVIFECAQIEKTDAAALQLLTGYYLFAIEEGKKVVWNNPSETFCHSINLLGLGDIVNVSLAA